MNWRILRENKSYCLFIISVYVKPTFTGLYNQNSLVPKSRNINLISSLVYRALLIFFSSCRFDQELDNIHRVFVTMVSLLMSLNTLFNVRLNALKKNSSFLSQPVPRLFKIIVVGQKKSKILAECRLVSRHVFLLACCVLFWRLIQCFLHSSKMVCSIFETVLLHINLNISAKLNTQGEPINDEELELFPASI